MRFSDHFRDERQHRPDRQNITIEMCERVVSSWMKRVHQADGRTAYWGRVEEEERYLRVVVSRMERRSG